MTFVGNMFRTGNWGTKKKNGAPPAAAAAAAGKDGSSGGGASATTSTSPFATRPSEAAQLENALAAANALMNDDIAAAEDTLRAGNASAYNDLGLCIITVMQAVMGFEPELMAEAVERARVCEKASAREWKAAESAHPGVTFATWQPRPERFYPPGSGYRVINAAAQLMHGLTSILDESDKLEKLGAAVKAFFKLRKAYGTLSEIIEFENRMIRRADPGHARQQRLALRAARMPGGFDDDDVEDIFGGGRGDDDDSAAADFAVPTGLPEIKSSSPMTDAFGHLTLAVDTSCAQNGSGSSSSSSSSGGGGGNGNSTTSSPPDSPPPTPTSASGGVPPAARSPLDDLTDPVDVFVHTGSSMAFGALQLILGTVPPAYRPLLAVVGFRGDRERGLALLWKASSHRNFCGALAGFILLTYYTSLASFSDILPSRGDFDADAEIIGYPEARVAGLLGDVRSRYPQSMLWRLIEGRVLGDAKRLPAAIGILSSGPESKMRQVTALTYWQLALDASFVRDWALTRDSFLRCVDLNDWTHALYFYCAGTAELELYRDAVARGAPAAERLTHKRAAEALLRRAPPMAGHKRLMTKRIPHEVFVERRVARWEARARELGVDLADAVGASPAQEMTYIWNGTKKMSEAEARLSLGDLRWDRCTAPPDVVAHIAALPEEAAVRAVCVSALLRQLGRHDEARSMLLSKALSCDRGLQVFKKEYVLPMATYEMAVIAWEEVCAMPTAAESPQGREARRLKLDDCTAWLDRACRWPDRYLMDGRFGLRFQTALGTLAWYKNKVGLN